MTCKHFGTDGIRGRANEVLTPELAMSVAKRRASCSDQRASAPG